MWPFSPRKPRPSASERLHRRSYQPRLEGLEDRRLLNAGALDPTFGSGAGYVTTSLSSGNDTGQQVLVQPSGNIVVAGTTTVPVTTATKHGTTTTNVNVFGAATYNPDGSLDTAFGSGGTVRQMFAGSAGGDVYTAALQPTGTPGDSKILLAGTNAAQTGMALMRLNANGSLDTTFGSSGQVVTYFPESTNNLEIARGIALTSSGQILVVGCHGYGSGNTVLLARYNANGSLDTTFGSGGEATTANAVSGVSALAIQPDGKFVVVGAENYTTNAYGPVSEGVVLRYNANGSLDTTFGSGGIVTTLLPFGATPYFTRNTGVAIYPNAGTANDGRIVVAGWVRTVTAAGYGEQEWAAVRYNPDGSLDSTFGNGVGYEIIPDPKFTYPYENANAVAIQADGKPILVGVAGGAGSSAGYSQVARLNVDGSLDSTFGSGGLVATAIGTRTPTASYFYAAALQPDGKILAAGAADMDNSSNKHVFTLARYLPSEPQVGSFTASPNPVTPGTSVTLAASNITDGNAGSTITLVTFYYVDGTGTKQVLGYGTQTSPGVWTLTSTVSLAPGSYTLYAQAQDSYGALGDPIALALQVL